MKEIGRGRLIQRQKIDSQNIERRKIERRKIECHKIERQNALIPQFPLNLELSYLVYEYNITKPYKAMPTFLNNALYFSGYFFVSSLSLPVILN